jgi:hypothetical protein
MIGSFAQAHNDYLDPDNYGLNDYVEGIEESIQNVMGFEEPMTPWKFYRSLYKSLPCGPTVVMWIEGEKRINDELPKDKDILDLCITGIEVGTIVEGWDDGYITGFVAHDEFEPKEFWNAMGDMEAVAHTVWACVNEHDDNCDCYVEAL